MSAGGDAAPSSRRRTVFLLLGCLLAPALIALVMWWWQQRPFESSALPAPPPQPESGLALRTATPPASVDQPAAPDAGRPSYEVGVALFSGYDRANTLAVELAAAGFRASTRSVESTKGRLYEVRTGPYLSREAAEADAAEIRKMPGYADARVVAPPAAAP
jgi:cell division septation protein DedD